MSNWMEMLANPQGQIVRNFLLDLLKNRYDKHQEITERISKTLVTKGDIDKFGKFVIELYEAGYIKAISDHRDALQQMGVKVQIKPQEPAVKAESIFGNQSM